MARSKNKNIGLIGLGIIGSAVATALRNRGLQVFVWNRTPRREQNFVGSPAEVAELCDVIQIFVADDEALLEIVRQLTPGLTAQHIVTAHCTVAPESMRAAAALVQRRGARFIEAPFTGSKVAAEKGQLVYYIGGDEAAVKQARPVLEASAKEIVLIGEIGDASVIKVATNLVTAATAQIAAEALALVRKAGISPELFARAMKSNASNSATLEMKLPLMLAGDFEPHFSVKHMLKDVRIASRLAREYSLELPVTEVASDMLLAQLKEGRGDADYSSVAQKYFSGSDVVVRPEPVKKPEPLAPATPPLASKEVQRESQPVAETDALAPKAEAAVSPAIAPEPVAESESPLLKLYPMVPPPIAAEPVSETKAIAAAAEVKEALQIVAEPDVERQPIVAVPEVKESPPVAAEPVIETQPIAAPPPVKESPPKPAEPMIGAKPAKPNWIDEDDEEEEDLPEGVNLSGGIRGWLSRRFSRSRRK